jgi:4,5-dihydroxyphthalate decarboxylase
MSNENSRLHLHTALKKYPHTAKLILGEIASSEVQLDCVEVEPIHRAFAPMARKQAYDVSEMAIVTYLQAKAYNKPLVLLPAVVASRFQQGCIVFNARKRPMMTVGDLAGARVGVRAYSQTTGVWVRGILAETYGIPSEKIHWVTFEGAHLEEYREPAFVSRAAPGKEMLSMLLDGELDAAIFGNDLPTHADLQPLIRDAAQADLLWYEKHRFVPVNHVVVMHRAVAERYPRSAHAVYALLQQAKEAARPAGSQPDPLPFGVEALRRPLEVALAFCDEQQLLPRRLTADEVLGDCLAVLGEQAR